MSQWYVVHTHARNERTAYDNLIRQGFKAFLPEYLRNRRHARKVDTVRAPLFPCYLFVSVDVVHEQWRSILSTIGVGRLICRGDLPLAVPPGVVEAIQDRADSEGLVTLRPSIQFRRGDPIQITAGAFAAQTGFFECVSDEDRIVLLLDMLGRKIKITVPLGNVVSYA